ncbi:hypothetical protein PtA15_6A841 [Puccinia triticina]|uniref:Uncharacterized protein n=1 Tax=Puccinia triticina TaxID=208348 RepID=A0ABY7CM25_9BASI|nr:uncharacterized protein PtA15_6A841 [Puccinia triticina]WAQ86209.1 hypothetical protein PtA15_6A841 [Puccinia triticina]
MANVDETSERMHRRKLRVYAGLRLPSLSIWARGRDVGKPQANDNALPESVQIGAV